MVQKVIYSPIMTQWCALSPSSLVIPFKRSQMLTKQASRLLPKNIQCSITYRITRHGCSIFFTTEGDNWRVSKTKASVAVWAKRGAARCSECNADWLTLQLAHEAVNKSGCKAGCEVGIRLCSPIPTITKLYGSVLASILGPSSFVIVI